MEKKVINEEALKIDNTALEQAMEVFQKDKTKENMTKLMGLVHMSRFLVPAEFPQNMKPDVMKKLAKGEVLTNAEAPKMTPVMMHDEDGIQYIPAFTSREQIDDEHRYQAILNVPIQEIMRLVLEPALNLEGILLNPTSNQMILHKKFVQAMKDAEEAVRKNHEMKMSKEQFEVFARRNVECGILPKAVYTQKAEFMNLLDEKREEHIFQYYRQPYGDQLPCPYTPSDFDVMVLNINPETCVASIELPKQNLVAHMAKSMYIVWNPANDTFRYFLIEQGENEEADVLCGVSEDGTHEALQTAPSSGNELMAILKLLEED